MKEQEVDLLIHAGFLLECPEEEITLTENKFIGIQKEKIAFIKKGKREDFLCKKFIDASKDLVMPGLVNAHAHLGMQFFKGTGEGVTLHSWLNNFVFPTESEKLSREYVQVATEVALIEAIEFGVTTTHDMYYFEDVVAEVCDRAGIRAVLGENFNSFPTPDNKENNGNDEKIIRLMHEKYHQHPRIHPWIAPHAPYTVSDEKYKAAHRLSKELDDMPICTHLAETQKEHEDSLKEHQKSPTQRLYELGLFEGNLNCAHCIHVDEKDFQLFEKHKNVSVVFNPESNMKLGSGIAPIEKFLEVGTHVGLGSDGVGSNNDLNLFKEMDFAAKLLLLNSKNPEKITPQKILRMASYGGAQSLFLQNLAKIKKNYLADLIILDVSVSNFFPPQNLISHLVFSSTGREVKSSICHGKILMENKELKTLNKAEIYQKAHRYLM